MGDIMPIPIIRGRLHSIRFEHVTYSFFLVTHLVNLVTTYVFIIIENLVKDKFLVLPPYGDTQMLFSSLTFKDEANQSYQKVHSVGTLNAVGRIGSPNLRGEQKREQKTIQHARVGALGTIGRLCQPTPNRQDSA